MSKRPTSKTLRLHLCTWNVGAARAEDVDFTEVFDLQNAKHPDLYCVGLQEVGANDLSLEEHPWSKAITACLGSKGYVLGIDMIPENDSLIHWCIMIPKFNISIILELKVRRMRGVMTIVYAKRCHLIYITSIESEATKTGMGGWWGNKGGSSIRLDLYGMNLIIVNAHLAAHRDNVAERIVDFNSILDDQKFKDEDVDNILDHDYVFWMGDLNFRLDELSYDEAIRYICNGDVKKLLAHDELIQCKEERLILEDFQEGKISFAPTYKFDKGTNTYDTSKKRRVPAWCDRILWHVYHESYGSVELSVKQINYKSHAPYKISDHKPVTSLMDIQVFPLKSLEISDAAQHHAIKWRDAERHRKSPKTVFGIPPPSPVKFNPLTTWYKSKDQTVAYSIKTKSYSSDWIGLFKADFTSFHDFVEYIWAKEGAEKSGNEGVKLSFPASKLTVMPGKYCLCYLTKKYSLQGISEEFVIVA